MLKTFLIPEQGLNALYDNGTKHLVLAKGRYSTSDEAQQRFLRGYPGVVSVSSTESDQPNKNPVIAFGPNHGQPVVTNSFCLQVREKQASTSSRVQED